MRIEQTSKPHAAHPGDNRDPSRGRRLAAGIVTTLLSRGVGALAPLLLIPLTYKSLGPALFGLWMTLTAITSMVAFADLGLGNGLMTRLAPCYSKGDEAAAKRNISTAYAVLVATAAALLLSLWSFSSIIPWTDIFNVEDSISGSQTSDVAIICLAIFVINIPASLIVRVQYAYQLVGVSNIWQSAGNLSSLAFAWTAVACDMKPAFVVGAATAGPLVFNIVNALWYFCARMPAIAPSIRDVDPRTARSLMSLSSRFFALTVITAVAMNADQLIIAHAVDLTAVAVYATMAKLLALLGMIINIINLPLWPANGDALAKGDATWVMRTTKLMTMASTISVAGTAAALLLASEMGWINWLGPARDQWPLITTLAIWWVSVAALSPRFMVQNATGVVAPQICGWLAFLLLSLPAKWFAAEKLGIEFVPLVGAAIYLLVVAPSAIIGYRKSISQSKQPLGDISP
ncbi:lipopolysaccharide biosynthesis protein [Pseudosporangium ferrugineum]|uniref:O-antigen/teichoic acid export membrane protein n=1 Tax=Pseudosporangium ferrugineum TaxID=439699 RepID=A0A2T0RDS1_9ACTN|nr:oligosaccharide flippase family protein [Pseudosporangium ferrugineum]PRY19301.1 O-antigen/teichoic acid export membrane protein [Pseudosporangium ferrugineum]